MTEDEIIGWHQDSMNKSLCKLWEMVKDTETSCVAVPGISESQT